MKNKYANNFTNFVRNKNKKEPALFDINNYLKKSKLSIEIFDFDYFEKELGNASNPNQKYILTKKFIIQYVSFSSLKKERDKYIQDRWDSRKRERELRLKLAAKKITKPRKKI